MDQAFRFVGSNHFSGEAGELGYADGIVPGDIDGDEVADFEIQVFQLSAFHANPTLGAGDFLF